MPNWTKEQEVAIEKTGCNIIVSAGAGSGKTAVLTERVIRKLKKGTDVNRLLILTFTNAAAKEMKERIRASIKEEKLIEQLEKIDSSYITTFDSFALSIVKKYHYLINLDQDIEIANDLILKWKKTEIIDLIFDSLYEKENPLFLKLIKDFTSRDDDKIKNHILDMYDKLDLKFDKEDYLKNYLDNYFNETYINSKIVEYNNILKSKIEKIDESLQELELMVDGDFYADFKDQLDSLLNSRDYNSIKSSLDIKLPRLKKGMTEVKPIKERISKLIDKLKKMTIYDNQEEIINSIYETKDYIEIIIYILTKLDELFTKFKFQNNLYDFLDISKLAIKIVSENEEVRLELKEYFEEILVDEYQDTSDLQEEFISLIANNNVYMVGDIKQSIYRFRNANPNLFKEKYDCYQNNIGGFKIDLVKNFRSREETLANINYVFNYIMDLEIGGADYKNYHQMVFGNTTYTEFKGENQNNDFEIYNYNLETKEYTKDEVEAFITVSDIIDKVNSNYQVYDKNIKKLRNICYDDFVILIDKSTSFELYKKIFEYKGVPLTILKDETISGSYDLYILKNILVLLKSVKEKKYDQVFKYAYLSIGRSYLFNLSDDYLYKRIKDNNYQDDLIINHLNNLIDLLDIVPVNILIERIIDEFSFYEKLITVGNINESIIRLDYLENLASNLSNLSYTYLDLENYFTKMIENNDEIKYSLNKDIKNSVKIMTIHKSKGLEYHVCYYTGLTNKFNVMDCKKRFLFDNNYGLVTPYLKDSLLMNTIYHTLYKDNYIKEDISERIRLFYVAMTRAKEKMILITNLGDDEVGDEELVELDTRLKYTSFASILNSISDKLIDYTKDIDLNNYELTKNYTIFKPDNILEKVDKTNEKVEVIEINSSNEIIEKERFSKGELLITKELKEKLEFGEYLHYIFEIIDLKNPNLDNIDKRYHRYINDFLKCDLLIDIKNANIYKEYEFIYTINNIKKHGIIDLMLEYEDKIDIIDYKLKRIDDNKYLEQLNGYKNYIETKTKREVNIYLYSIIDSNYKKLD